jgi:hypothetical protein
MRRLAIAIVLAGASLVSQAQADPFDRIASRLDQYDAEVRGERHAAPGERRVAYQEEVQPTPVPDAGPGPAEAYPPQYDDYGHEPMWGEPMMGGCGDSCCDPCCNWGCIPPGFWGRAEYLGWWVRGSNTPALVTTSADGTPVGIAGVLPGATVLFGNERINNQGRSGARFTLGYWADPCETLGIEDTFFFLGTENDPFFATSSGTPILARPFFNTSLGEQDAILVAYPQIVVGSIDITTSSKVFSNEVNLRRSLYADGCRRIDVLAGYRFFQLSEYLHIQTDTVAIDDPSVPAGTAFGIRDLFNTRSQFNGGQLALNLQYFRNCWTFDFMFKLAIGGVSQQVSIEGSTEVRVPDEPVVTNTGGILALASNSGLHKQTQFGVLPEFSANVRYQWTPLWRINLGYNFMALTNVVRPGDQIDLRLDPAQFPPGTPGTFPQFAFHESDVWLQGINVGLECNF